LAALPAAPAWWRQVWQSQPKHPEVLATRCSTWPCHAVNTRSNALYDRCATERRALEVSPTAGKRAGQKAWRLPNRFDSRPLPADQ
jgi:hypothetical protein